MKLSYILLFGASFVSFQAYAMDPYFEEKIYDHDIKPNLGIFYHCNDGTSLLTQPKAPQKSYSQKVLIYTEEPQERQREKILKRVNLGQDGRNRITETTRPPYSMFTQLTIVFDGKSYGGSGALVGPHHVLTCGHNVYDKGRWSEKILVYPALNDNNPPFGEVKVIKAYALKDWVSSENKEHDLALLILNESIGEYTGWAGLLSIDDTRAAQALISITGYPGGPGKNCKQMWSMSHTIKEVKPEEFDYEIDTYGGQSGSPIWINESEMPMILGVHTRGNISINSGVRISKKKFTDFLIKIISDTHFLQKSSPPSPSPTTTTTTTIAPPSVSYDFPQGALATPQPSSPSVPLPSHSFSATSNPGNPFQPFVNSGVTQTTTTTTTIAATTSSFSFDEWRERLKNNRTPWGKYLWEQCTTQNLGRLILGHGTNMGAEGALALSQGNLTALKSLHLWPNNIGSAGAHVLSQGNFPSLTLLDLEGNNIDFAGAEALSQSNLLTLKKLILQKNKIEDKGARAIAQGKLTNLIKLDLGENNIGTAGATALSQGNLTNLTELNLQTNNIEDAGGLALSQGNLSALTSLYLTKNNIGYVGAIALAQGNLTNLKSLLLNANHIGDEGTRALSQGNFPVLRELNLNSNHIGPEGANHLANFWFVSGNLPALIILSLDNNHIGNEGAKCFAGANPSTFVSLSLKNNNIDKKGKRILKQVDDDNSKFEIYY